MLFYLLINGGINIFLIAYVAPYKYKFTDTHTHTHIYTQASQVVLVVKSSPANAV